MGPDARNAVSEGLRRLVAAGAWPASDLRVFQNRLLDEAGGDTRPLVSLLLRATEQGIPEDLSGARGDAWPAQRARLALRLTTNAFVQPEMALWAVEAWAFALGVIEHPTAPGRVDPGPEPFPQARRATAPAPVPLAAAPPVARTLPPWKVWRAPVRPGLPTRAPQGARDIRPDLIAFAILMGMIAVAALVAYVGIARLPDTPVAVAARPPVSRAPVAAVRSTVSGRYRVDRTLEALTGDPSCEGLASHEEWARSTDEVIERDAGTARFHFASRPGVQGRLYPDGGFEADPFEGEKDGMQYAFTMIGRFTPTGFEARSETTTWAVIRWRKTQTCHFTTRLVGRRIG